MLEKIFSTLFLWNFHIIISTCDLQFAEDFIFSASTSCYQIEGAWNVAGKGENIWDRFTHKNLNSIKDGGNGDNAAESYYFYKDDSNILKEIGFHMYRFSISWTRILPNGDLSEINQAGIQHYHHVIDDLLEKNIQPMITIYHYDLPQKLQDAGGWLNSSIVDHIENYADILFYYYGDRVNWWITINEPYFIVQGYSNNNSNAPSLGLGSPDDYIITHNILMAHKRIYRMYEKKYKTRQKGKISISLNYDTCYPKTQSQQDIEAAERYFQFSLGIYAHPIYSLEGDYPKLVRKIVHDNSIEEGATKSRLPTFTEEEKSSIRGTYDFFSFNYYTSNICSSHSRNNCRDDTLTYDRDMNVHVYQNYSLPTHQGIGWAIDATGFREILKKIRQEYNDPEIFVTENGYGGIDELNDVSRIRYHREHLQELLKAQYYDGCNIIGYTVWSLLDTFEWKEGYKSKFGIVRVDFNSTTKKRTRKKSSYFFQELVTGNGTIP